MSRVVMTVENLLVPRLSSLLEARWTIGLTETVAALTMVAFHILIPYTAHSMRRRRMARAVCPGHSESGELPRTVQIVI